MQLLIWSNAAALVERERKRRRDNDLSAKSSAKVEWQDPLKDGKNITLAARDRKIIFFFSLNFHFKKCFKIWIKYSYQIGYKTNYNFFLKKFNITI